MDLNVLVIGDPHIMESDVREITELIEKIDILLSMRGKTYKEINAAYGNPERGPEVTDGTFDVDFVVCLGDILHKHEKGNSTAHTYAIRFFETIKKYVPLFVLIGNHDRQTNNDFLSDFHFFNGLNESSNLKIIDKVKVFSISKDLSGNLKISDVESRDLPVPSVPSVPQGIHGGKDKFIFVPYVPNGRFMDALDTKKSYIDFESTHCIFAHQEFKGAKYNGITSEIGDNLDGRKLPLIVSGHIHEYGDTVMNGGVIYVGSSRQIVRNEDPHKTISNFTFSSGISYIHRRICLNLLKKIIVRVNYTDVSKFIPDEKAVTYLIIEGTTTEIKVLKKIKAFKDLDKHPNVRISYDIKDSDEGILDMEQSKQLTTGNTGDYKVSTAVSYILKLKEAIKGDALELEIFNSLFSV